MKRKLIRLLSLFLVVVVFATQTPYIAEASQTTRDKIAEAEKEKKKIEEEMDEKDKEINKLNSKQTSLEREIDGLNDDLQAIVDRLDELDNQITEKQTEIEDTQAKLEEARNIEAEQYEAMKKRIKYMYEESSTLYIEIIFKAKSFSEFLTLSNYADSLANYDKKKFDEYQTTRIEIEDLEAKLQSDKVDLQVLQAEAEQEKENVMKVISAKSDKVKEYDSLIDDAEAAYLKKEAELKAKEEDLDALNKQLAEEIRLSQLSRNSVWRNISDVTFDEGDRYLLANLIYCEAGGEPYEGQVAVGAVVINRVLSPVFPATVTGVIYQKSQFSPVGSGRLAYALSVNKATDSCYRAADAAMSGITNVGNCVYFRTPVPGLEGIRIGNHVFY